MNNIEVIENGIIDLNERKLQVNENNIKVLESVKEILTLGDEYITVKMCADYFEVVENSIKSVISRHKEELKENGFKMFSRKYVNSLNMHNATLEKVDKYKDVIHNNGEEIIVSNRGISLLTKRTLLNIGMLLRDSNIAKELRRRILDIVHDAEDDKGSIENIVNEIDEETKLSMDLGVAMVKGNMNDVMNLNTKIFELKNKRIKQLENIIENSVTINDSKAKIRMCINYITPRKYNGKYGLAWNDLYRFVNYKLGININGRSGNGLARFTDDEIRQIEIISKSWLNELGYEVDFKL